MLNMVKRGKLNAATCKKDYTLWHSGVIAGMQGCQQDYKISYQYTKINCISTTLGKQSKNKIEKTNLFIIVSQRKKYLEINVIRL